MVFFPVNEAGPSISLVLEGEAIFLLHMHGGCRRSPGAVPRQLNPNDLNLGKQCEEERQSSRRRVPPVCTEGEKPRGTPERGAP